MQNGDFSEEGAEEVSNGSFSQEGAEEIVNGDFATDSDWNLRGAWVISNGICSLTAPNSDYLSQANVLTANKFYKLTFDIVVNSGNLQPQFFDSGFQTIETYSTSQSVEVYFQSTTTGTLYFKPNSFDGSIDNVSVREVGQDWSLENTWTIGDSVANGNGANGSSEELTQSGVTTIGKTYKVTYEILNYVSGSITFLGSNLGYVSANGIYTDYYTSATSTLKFRPNNFNGSITNISVKEVGMGWTLGTGWSIDQANSKATCDGSQTSTSTLQTAQGISNIQNDLVKLSFEIKDYSAGAISSVTLQGTGGIEFSNLAANGVYEINITSSDASPRLLFNANSSFVGSITNISVIEITDDTNLPRINYEGFSYQDVLGSEEIVNGDFSNGSANWSVGSNSEINNGSARIYSPSGGYTFISQSNVLTIGKTYLISLEIVEQNLGEIRLSDGSGYLSNSFSGVGIHTFKSTSLGTILRIQRTASITDITIDNVSVKEVTGQSVVPNSGCGSWLFESQSTNLYTQSELFTDSSWSKTQTVIEASSITLPNGLTNGYKLFANTTGGTNHWFEKFPFPTATTGQDYTLSLFVKSAGSDFIQIAASTGFPVKYQNFNISTGTKLSGNTSGSSITDFGNGWYRISVTETTISTTARYLIVPILSDVGRNAQFAGNANEDGVYIWGAMLEQNSFSTSYIPTSGSTVTRNQDVCNNGATGAGLINSTEGVLYAEIASLSNIVPSNYISLSDGTYSNRISILYSSGTNIIRAFLRLGGAVQADMTFTVSDITEFHKVAFKFKENDFALWIDGVEVRTDTSGFTMPSGTLSKLSFSEINTAGGLFRGKTKTLAVWKEALSDSELQSLTTI